MTNNITSKQLHNLVNHTQKIYIYISFLNSDNTGSHISHFMFEYMNDILDCLHFLSVLHTNLFIIIRTKNIALKSYDYCYVAFLALDSP